MSRTPAAQLARLKVTYQSWYIQRTAEGGFTAQPRRGWGGHDISAPTVAELENALAGAEADKAP
jgi:hypothetical protein